MTVQIFWGVISYIMFALGFISQVILIVSKPDSSAEWEIVAWLSVLSCYVGGFTANFFARK